MLAESRRAYTNLALFGYRVNAAIVAQVFPEGGSDPWLTQWVESQRRVVDDAADSFAGLMDGIVGGERRRNRRPCCSLSAGPGNVRRLGPVGAQCAAAGSGSRSGDRDRVLVAALTMAAQEDVRLSDG